MEKEYIKISEYAKRMSIHIRTAYRYYHNGKLKGYQDELTKTIFILNPFKQEEKRDNLRVVLYSRVSSNKNKDSLDKQMERLKMFALAKGYQIVKEVKEIGSGLNDNRQKLNNLFEKELNNFDILLVEHKDRLTRFGFNYIDMLLKSLNKKVEVINLADNKEDLIQDFVSCITSFCARIYGQKRYKRKAEQIIKELEKCE